jgi:predicted ATP-grasp superfamily ATP-dependent carboligase
MDLVRPLGLAGVRSVVVAEPGAALTSSRFVDGTIAWDGDWSAAADADELADRLLWHARREPEPPVLFYQHDEHALFVSRRRRQLARALRFVIAPAEQVETIVDKPRFHRRAAALGLPVPETRVLDPAAPLPADLRYPVVVKPPTRADPAWQALDVPAKAIRADGPDELDRLRPRLAALVGDVVVQRAVPGPESDICSYHVYVDDRDEIAGEFTGRKIRTWPREFGHTTALVTTDAEDVARLGRSTVRSLGLRGVAKVDCKRDAEGRLWLLEVNPRFNLWHHAGALAGVNLPALAWADAAGRPRPAAGRARPGVRWCHVNDAAAARDAGVPVARWAAWAWRCQAKANLAWDDPVPAARRALQLLPRPAR